MFFSTIAFHLLTLRCIKKNVMTIDSITITLSVENTARADVMLSSLRAYYRFATIDTCDEGDMPYENAVEVFDKINQALSTTDSEPMPNDVKCIISIINKDKTKTDYNNQNISLSAYNSLINILSRISDEFMFIRGFK